ncbi:MAG: sigma-70 family RNA polymerase sigma factor [Chloroflexota bacterium]
MPDTKTKQLMARIAKRDQHALTALYEQHSERIYRMAYQVTQHRDSAEEITQDVFFQIWRWPERWDPERGKFTSWVLTVTRYTAIDYIRRQQRRPVTDAYHDETTSHVASEQPAAAYHASARDEAVQKTLKRLPKEQRVVIMLAFFRGMTHNEIADHLNVPLGTVKSRMRLGMEKLRSSLKEHASDT